MSKIWILSIVLWACGQGPTPGPRQNSFSGPLVTGGGGSGITNSAGANVVMKSNGFNAVASSILDDAVTVATSLPFSALTIRTGGFGGSTWYKGVGVPVISCAVGDIFSRTNGGPLAVVYACTATNVWTAVSTTTTTIAAAHVDSGTGLFTKQEGFVGNPLKNGVGDWTLTYATAMNTDQGVVLATVQDQGGAATRMNITVQSVDTTHVRVRTFSNGTASDQHFWIRLAALN